jgi:hypothetical protein
MMIEEDDRDEGDKGEERAEGEKREDILNFSSSISSNKAVCSWIVFK